MQINFRLLPVFTLAIFTTFTACKKDSKPAEESTNELATHADNQSRVSAQIDAVSNDASLAIESSAAYSGGRMQNPPLTTICDATISFDSASNPKKITITYDGTTSCNASYSRTGTVVISMASGVRWKDQGATVTVTYQNLKVKRTIDNKSITINGSHSITNASGGLLYMLLFSQPGQSVTHRVSGSLTITFDDNTQRTWEIAHRRVFSSENGKFVLTVTGDKTNTEGVAEWGTNRFGNAFTTSITQPLVIRQDCAFRLVSGQVKHEGFGTATATFGLDANGNPASCPGAAGHYYYKLVWTGPNGGSLSATLPY
ncbi:MAG: hypothetical protein J7502_01310 [Flavisolibacter sp.]|nr:hypothetical protein [Flavisolibacter sp.]